MEKDTHTTKIEVRYAETDQMGVVYYSNHFVWFEVARTDFFRSRGLDYGRIEKEERIFLPVAEATCRYKLPVTYGNPVEVVTKLSEVGNSRLVFDYEIRQDGKTAATGSTRHAFVDERGRPVTMPDYIREGLKKAAFLSHP